MRNSEYVFTATDKLGEHWFNADPRRFALLPTPSVEAFETLAVEVESLVSRFVTSKSTSARAVVVADLVALHAQGKILWPLGALFDHSVLGRMLKRRLVLDLTAAGSDLLVLLDELGSTDSPFAQYRSSARQYAYVTWKTLVALRLATTMPLTTLRTYDHAAFEAFAGVASPGGQWVEWFPHDHVKGLRYAARFLAAELGDPHFGASVFRFARLQGPRRVDPFKACPHLAWLDTLYEQWLDETNVLQKDRARSGKRLLGEFFMTLPIEKPSRVETAFNDDDMRALERFAWTWSTPSERRAAMNRLNGFLDFLVRQHSAKALNITGPMLLALERHEIEHFTKRVHVPRRASLTGEVQARPMPTRYHQRLKEIITENDFAWPKSLRNGSTDRPRHWIAWRDPETGKPSEIFCPVLARLLLLQLDLPLRNIQARRLDSGEGDTERWNARTGIWEPNTGTHGGRWERMGAANPRRGVIRRLTAGEGKTVTGIWVNSNKTIDRHQLFDETAGYEIPWEDMDILRNLAAMRDWQERYNPVDRPLAHADTPEHIFDNEPSEMVAALIPDRFYLFRYPPNPGPRGGEAPPSYQTYLQFFHDALEELERRLNEEDPETPLRIITHRNKSGAPKKAVFTAHGMRSSTLTGLHMAGVPIAMLSKVVAGHASILMTLNYIKFDPLHVSQVLTDARLKAASEAKDQFPDLLRNAAFEDMIKMTARLNDDGLVQMKGGYSEPSVWLRLDIGLCPNGATQCRVGGEAKQRRQDNGLDKSIYASVPGGPRNCVRCRFFVTGLPFLIPLWAHGSAIMVKADALAKQAIDRASEARILKQKRIERSEQGQPQDRDLSRLIRELDELHVADCEQRDQALADLHHTLALIEKVRAIGKQVGVPGNKGLPMLLPEEGIPELASREGTRFEIVDAVVQQSRWFRSLESADAERERDEFLNRILHRNGYVPITMAPLSKSERQLGADAMAKFLLMELGAWETEHLATGRKSLVELELQEGFDAACRSAIGRPLERIEMRPTIDGLAIDGQAVVEVPRLSFAPRGHLEGQAKANT